LFQATSLTQNNGTSQLPDEHRLPPVDECWLLLPIPILKCQ
jgi:hypothetical protein